MDSPNAQAPTPNPSDTFARLTRARAVFAILQFDKLKNCVYDPQLLRNGLAIERKIVAKLPQ